VVINRQHMPARTTPNTVMWEDGDLFIAPLLAGGQGESMAATRLPVVEARLGMLQLSQRRPRGRDVRLLQPTSEGGSLRANLDH